MLASPSPPSLQNALPLSSDGFWRFALLLAALVLLIYYPALSAKFIWDDLEIIGHRYMRSLNGLVTIWLSPNQSICGDYWPINYTSHWIEYQLWGMNPRGYHAVNMLLHWANACALLYLLQRMAVRGALLVAILFVIHPMQVSSVAWAVERKDLLNTLFYILAFVAWVRFEEERSLKRYLVVFLFFAASLLSKSMSITWPAAAFVYCWWSAGRIDWRRVLPLLPLLLFAFFLTIVSIGIHRKIDLLPADALFSVPEKLILVGKNLAFYAKKLIWPLEHVPVYPLWKIDARQWTHYLPVAAAVGVWVILWALRRRIGRGPCAAIAFYVITLSPILGFVYWGLLLITYVQDHYQYLACVGPFLLFAYAFDTYAPRLFPPTQPRKFAYGGLLLILVPLAVVAHQHAALYRDQETLFAENCARYPELSEAQLCYAWGLASNAKYTEALPVVEKAIAIAPRSSIAWRRKGYILTNLGRNEEASVAYKQALSFCTDKLDIDAVNGYTTILLNTPDPVIRPVVPLLERAFAQNPYNVLTEGHLAIVLSLSGRKAEAEKHFESVIRAQFTATPFNVLYYYGKLCLEKGEAEKALPFLRLAREGAPKRPEYLEAVQQAEAAIQNTNPVGKNKR